MSTAGGAGVSPSGAANYSIPIQLPPSIAGMGPKLSLQYSSQDGNGLLGIGWSLSGLSAITRCPAIRDSYAVKAGINYTQKDRFCLDGQHLMYGGPTASYGKAGTVYKTEIESFSKITSNGTQGTGPASFTVKTKAGLTLQYGATTDSAIMVVGSSTVRLWALNQVTDSAGNFMTVSYTGDAVNGSYYPAQINYTGNGTQVPTNSIAFNYITRSDQLPFYTGGAVVKNTKLLSNIKTYANGSLVQTYQLSYGNQTYGSQLSVLTGVQQIFADGSMLPVTQVNWPAVQNFSSGCAPNCAQAFASSPIASITDTSQSYTGWQGTMAPLTGSGFNDFVGYSVTNTTVNIQAWLGNGAGAFTKAAAVTPVTLASGTTSSNLLIGDLNGDGIPDVVIPSCGPSALLTVTTLKGLGTGTFATPVTKTYPGFQCTGVANFRLSDQNNTGQADIFWVSGSGTALSISILANNGLGGFATPIDIYTQANSVPSGFSVGNIQPNIYWIDIDGDGNPDLVLLYANGNSVAVQYFPGTTGGGLYPPVTLMSYSGTPGNSSYTYSGNYNLQLVDLNGGGTPDLIAMAQGASGASADVWMNTGSGGFGSVRLNALYSTATNFSGWTPLFASIKGDGIVDLVYANANAASGTQAAYVFFGNGDGSFTTGYGVPSLTGSSAAGQTGWTMLASDLSGAGRNDLLAFNPTSTGMYVQSWTNAVANAPTLVSSINNGLGITNSFNYSTLSNPAVYTPGGQASFPQINLNVPISVVSSLDSPDGLGGKITTSYKYSGYRTEMYTGRGPVGFATMTATQQQGVNTVSTTTTYSQSWPYTGLPLSTVKTNSAAAGPSHQVSQITTSYNCLNCTISSATVYFPYAQQTLERNWDLDGTVLPGLTSTYTYDTYGNALTTTQTTGDGYSKSTANTYTNDITNWYLGRLTKSVLTSVSPAGSLSRTSAFTYNATSGLLDSETIEPTLPQLCQTTSYAFDAYGNKSGATTANCSGATGAALFTSRTPTSSTTATSANPVAGQFVTSSTNALGQSENHQFDPKFGAMTSLTGPNALTTQWTFDAQGRQTLETRADGTRTGTQYLYCAGFNGGVVSCPTINGVVGVYLIVSTPLASDGVTQNGAWSKSYFDALGRKIRSETQGFDGTGSSSSIYQDVEYNNLGQAITVSRPYYSGQTAYWAATAYDALGRAYMVTEADGSISSTQYSGLVTTLTNAKNQVTVITRNNRAQVTSVKDANNQTTKYAYDPLGNLVNTTDVAGNIVTLTNDLRGNKTKMVDPDMGTWSYTYNALGQMVSQTDAKNNTTSLTYDLLGRLLQRSEADLISNWYFDTYSGGVTCTKGIGKLCQSTTSTGYNYQTVYDSLARFSASTTTIDTSYSDSATYDANGRLSTRTYPGGIVVQYAYTPLGYLKSVTRVSSSTVLWSADSLDAEGHLLQQTLGNGILSTQTFKPENGRLTGIAAGVGNTVQNATYQHDVLGNVSNRNDLTQNLQETFFFDSLNRLSTSTVNASASAYTDTYNYANSGNVSSRSDLGTYSYQTISAPLSAGASCPGNSIASGPNCIFYQTTAATPTYVCPTGMTISGGNCAGTKSIAASVSGYSCPNGYRLEGTTCIRTTTTAVTDVTTCPSGFMKVSGTSQYGCFAQFTKTTGSLTPNQCIATGATYAMAFTNIFTDSSGSICVYEFIHTYTCPTGATMVGASCVADTSVAATAAYACPSGTLSGSTCSVSTSAPPTVSKYTCPTGQVAAGNVCVNNTASTAIAGKCPTGQTLSGTLCVMNGVSNPGPHALSLVSLTGGLGSRAYGYDANGNRTSEVWQNGSSVANTLSYSYTSYNKILGISATSGSGTVNEAYAYGPEHQRVRMTSTTLGTVYYVHPGSSGELFFEKEVKTDNSIELRSYVTAGGGVVALIKQITSSGGAASEQTRYLHRDSLGSTSVITDEAGNVLEQLAYEPFGKRRQVGGAQDPSNTISDSINQRGFTNHEHLDELGLINMNGRVYDPMTARFISADPIIQEPYNSQSYNRYSYVVNSPLNLTDPSGYSFWTDPSASTTGTLNHWGDAISGELNHWGDVIATNPVANMVVSTVVAYYVGNWVGSAAGSKAVGAAVGGFAGGMASSGGNVNTSLQGAATALMFYGVGSAAPYSATATQAANPVGNVLGHAAVGCISATMSGGNCGAGAMSAGIADYASNTMPSAFKGNIASETAYVAVVGGTASVISGGKFENGAQTAAFGYLFNECLHTRMCGSSSTKVVASGNRVLGDMAHTELQVGDGYDFVVLEGQPGYENGNGRLEGRSNGMNQGEAFSISLNPLDGRTMAQFARDLRTAAASYGDNLTYSFPSPSYRLNNLNGGYNSNSFAGGVLDAAAPGAGLRYVVQGAASRAGFRIPGMENPIPLAPIR